MKLENELKLLTSWSIVGVPTSRLGTTAIKLSYDVALLLSLAPFIICVFLDSGAISGGLEVENGVSLRRYDSGIGDDHTSTAASDADLSSSAVTHGPDAISEALSTLSSEVRPPLPADSKGKSVKDILRSLVSAPADVMVDPSLLPPAFLGNLGDATRESSLLFRSFDRWGLRFKHASAYTYATMLFIGNRIFLPSTLGIVRKISGL